MIENWANSIGSWLKNSLRVWSGDPVAKPRAPASSTTGGAVQDIAPGPGPAWGTLSGLTAHASDPTRLYAVTDKDSAPIRIVEIVITPHSAEVVRQINVTAPGFEGLDSEGIVAKPDGGFWLASEGGLGNVPPNVLLEVDAAGQTRRSIPLPETIARRMPQKGIEGIALDMTGASPRLVVAFQAPIDGDRADLTRIGAVDLATGLWTFYHYPLTRTSSDDLTGLSELLHLGDGTFAAIERDGKGGKASIKWLTTFDLGHRPGAAPDQSPPMLEKRVAVDLVPLFIASGRKVEKEIEGLAVARDGQVYAITDNDNERATVLLRLGKAEDLF